MAFLAFLLGCSLLAHFIMWVHFSVKVRDLRYEKVKLSDDVLSWKRARDTYKERMEWLAWRIPGANFLDPRKEFTGVCWYFGHLKRQETKVKANGHKIPWYGGIEGAIDLAKEKDKA